MVRPTDTIAVWRPAYALAAIGVVALTVTPILGFVGQATLEQPARQSLPIRQSPQDLDDTTEQKVVDVKREAAQKRTTWTAPELVAGHDKCVDCHKPEVKAWLASKHSSRAFDLLRTSESAVEYAKQLNIRPSEIASSSLCVNCHATPQQVAGRPVLIPGVSCESCHNGSDGDQGWLNSHAVYGFADTQREQETPDHYALREARCLESGQLRSSNLYGLTKRCFECHVIGDEVLANSGHNHGDGFEMIAKSLGEIRHNFLLNEHENAKTSTLWSDPHRHGTSRTIDGRLRVMFILGQMVDLEISLRNLARATEENDFSDAMSGRIEDALELLAEDILEEFEDESEESDAPSNGITNELAEIQAVVDVVMPVWESLDDDGFDPEQATQYVTTADRISEIAKQFQNRDGSKLAFLDELELLPEDYYEGAYDPNPANPESADDH